MQITSSALLSTKRPLDSIRRITPAEAVVLVEGGFATLVEAHRRATESQSAIHIEGAMAVSLYEIETALQPSRLEALPKNHLLIVYGSGTDDDAIHQTAQGLIRRGADPARVAILAGSPDTWDSVGLPVFRISPDDEN